MRFLSLIAASLPLLAAAMPLRRNNWQINDLEVLNFALAIEQLENAFYQQGLARYFNQDFIKAGLPDWARGRFLQIQRNERDHLWFIDNALQFANAQLVKPCRYNFPDNDPTSFAWTSVDLETLATSAYNGALQYINNNEYVTAAGSIMSVEARQNGWVNSAIFQKNPWNTAFDIPLTFRQAYSLAQNYIEWCPPENAGLLPPGTSDVFPPLDIQGNVTPGQRIRFGFPGVENCENSYYEVVFLTGIGELRVRLEKDGWFVVPREVWARGAVYVFVVNNNQPVNDNNIAAGPTLVQFQFSSYDFYTPEDDDNDN